MAADLEHPERVVGFHFFNPVAVLPLLEIIKGERTDDATLATAFAVGKELRKSSVLVKDAPAFVVNRLLTRFTSEVFNAIDAGTPLDGGRHGAGPAGPADAADRAAAAGRARRSRCTSARPCTGRSRTASATAPTSRKIVDAGLPLMVDDEINPEVVKLVEVGSAPLTADEVRQQALDALAAGDPADAGRGRRRRGAGHRPVHAARARAGRSTWAA